MKKITPFLWFDGQAEVSAKFYCSIFKKSKILNSNALSTSFILEEQEFVAMNGGPHFKITPAISFYINCKTQKEIDYYWTKLSKDGTQMQCGWLTDKFGVTWQVIPDCLQTYIGSRDEIKASRAMKAMLKMKKINITKLKNAYLGRKTKNLNSN